MNEVLADEILDSMNNSKQNALTQTSVKLIEKWLDLTSPRLNNKMIDALLMEGNHLQKWVVKIFKIVLQ